MKKDDMTEQEMNLQIINEMRTLMMHAPENEVWGETKKSIMNWSCPPTFSQTFSSLVMGLTNSEVSEFSSKLMSAIIDFVSENFGGESDNSPSFLPIKENLKAHCFIMLGGYDDLAKMVFNWNTIPQKSDLADLVDAIDEHMEDDDQNKRFVKSVVYRMMDSLTNKPILH